MNTAPQLSRIGKYRLIATIGHGGMAHIHLALMAGVAGFNKLLVIKALREDIAASTDDFVTMFLDEARLAARLNHQNIVQSYEVGQAEGRYFIAMEYLEGQSMKTVERRLSPGGLPLPMQLRIIADVAKGLHHAHSLTGFDGEHLGVVHRDVSPHNVFLTYDGQVKLLDFGIAKAANALHLTKVGVIKGKADYIAPEQIRGDEIDCRADIFSLGVMMWEALAGRRFAGGIDVSEITKMHQRLTGGEAKLRDVNPEVPERLAQICERAIALDPTHRHPSALELSQDLDDYLADSSLHPNAKQLADMIGPCFRREREQLRKLIDEQMKLALDPMTNFESTTGALPVLPAPRVSQASGVWNLQEAGNSSVTFTPTTSSGIPSQMTRTAFPEARARKAPWPIVIVVMLLAVGGGGYFAMRSAEAPASPDAASNVQGAAATQDTQTAQDTQALASQAPGAQAVGTQGAQAPTRVQASERSAQEQIRLRITAEPSTAEATVDGAQVTLPFDAEVAASREAHEIVITAEGFAPHRTLLPYDRDQSVAVTLDPLVSAKKRPPTRPASARSAPGISSSSAQPASVSAGAPSIALSDNPSAPVEPGMDFRRLNADRAAVEANIVLEEDPYR